MGASQMKFPYNIQLTPAAPALELYLGLPDEALRVGPITAIVDTGADTTVIPEHYLHKLALTPDSHRFLTSPWGGRQLAKVYFLDVRLGEWRFPTVMVVGDQYGQEAIIGRNLLNKLVLTLHGPQQWLEISA